MTSKESDVDSDDNFGFRHSTKFDPAQGKAAVQRLIEAFIFKLMCEEDAVNSEGLAGPVLAGSSALATVGHAEEGRSEEQGADRREGE